MPDMLLERPDRKLERLRRLEQEVRYIRHRYVVAKMWIYDRAFPTYRYYPDSGVFETIYSPEIVKMLEMYDEACQQEIAYLIEKEKP